MSKAFTKEDVETDLEPRDDEPRPRGPQHKFGVDRRRNRARIAPLTWSSNC